MEKVYEPETIQDQPFPQSIEDSFGVSQNTGGGTYSTQNIKDNPYPIQRVATELLSTVLNTKSKKILQEFQINDQGGIKVGKYELGESGEIVISRNGLVAVDKNGNVTLVLDGDTGDATFAGILQTGTLISGEILLGDGNISIDGEARRMVFFNDSIPSIVIGEV